MAETAKFTPGPWTFSATYPAGDYCIHARGIPQQLAYVPASTVFEWPLEANARLIAAAPDLAACVRSLLDLHEAHHNHPLHAAARALIANATGEGK